MTLKYGRLWTGELGWRRELVRRYGKCRTLKKLSKATKKQMSEVLVFSTCTLLYNAETETCIQREAKTETWSMQWHAYGRYKKSREETEYTAAILWTPDSG